MAEYWKSAPRYWCKQCKIFIRDTAFEKAQHEATGKHQGNLKRFLRDIHRDNERQQRETQRAKNEVERLRQTVAGNAPGKSSDAAPWKRAPPVSEVPRRPASLDERKKQMAQLADMGVAIPEEYRGDMALAGEWQTLSEKVIGAEEGEKTGPSLGVRKRKHEGDEEEEEAKREAERFVSKGWGSRTREYPGAQDDEDLDALLESSKEVKKARPSSSEVAPTESVKEADDVPAKDEADPVATESDQVPKTEHEPAEAAAVPLTPAAKSEPEEPTSGVVFKKRKPKVMRK
ncbi:putative formin binding protein [Aspergillus alliaceus]|uniref:putative formin binding protein n=1 Tax=Petromyces alliaceus TaxID=209559 RepID=UPI0012A6FE83|nr:putative formin binding protein [Aspergillus alliaceus]KAB8232306.1 putative formin binding protein [Aspergillus alliaceus]